MTCIAPTKFKTKKAFKEEAQASPDNVFIEDPSIFDPFYGSVKQMLEKNGSFTITNHPKRSWFASVTLDKNGKVKVS